MCDCEAGLDRYVGRRRHVCLHARWAPRGDSPVSSAPLPQRARRRTQRALLVRISQNVLTCPTTACFNLLDTTPYFKLGRKVAYFGDGYQFRDTRYGRSVWVVPILSGEFIIDRRFGYCDGLMGGDLWLFGKDLDSALAAAERCTGAIARTPGVITPFPGGVVGSGSKPGSRYSFAIASTYEQLCPTLRDRPGLESKLPHDVHAVMEIIIDGRDILSIIAATQAAIAAAVDTPGLVKISAGNYRGKLGKSLIYLRPDRQPVQ